jgi:hypothetical protein
MLALLAVLAATHNIDLPKTFASTLPRVKAHTSVPVLLPQRFPSEFRRVFPSGVGHRRSWSLGLGAIRHCGGADACFVASFGGHRGGPRPFGRRTVRLAGGITGRFTPLSCGASCAPPQIQWRVGSATYGIQAVVGNRRTERRILVRMANSAIRSGPRR